MNLTELRANLYQTIDKVIETGIPVEIERKGQTVKIIVEKKPSKFAQLKRREGIISCSDDELINHDEYYKWDENNDLD